MPSWEAVKREHVLRAVAEFDRLGQEEFLTQHGFGQATGYLLVVEETSYDSKAVAGVAHELATGEKLTPEDFSSGGKDGAAGVLRGLGFQVDGPDEGRPTSKTRSGTFRESDGTTVTLPEAQAVWLPAARERLIAVAGEYHAITTYKELSAQIQEDSGVRTRMLLMNWIGGVLTLVAADCAERGEPLLSSLCVNAEGSVGPGYGPSVESLRGTAPEDPDEHAAAERLACYKHFGATIPDGGGRPALSPTMQARKDRATAALPERRGSLCPTCFVELPVAATRCMNCDA